jgi:hypothetical protein
VLSVGWVSGSVTQQSSIYGVDTISPNQSQAAFKSIVVDRVAGVLRHQNKYVPFFA